MTNDERISAYIDNELTADQEQELLISLAASETLRKSFRSELVLKKVLHADERAVNPPRQLRTAVFAAIGIGAASMAASETAHAATVQAPSFSTASAPSHGFLKTLFASKLNALLTATGLTVAGIAGFGVHSLITPTPAHEVVAPAATSAPVTTSVPTTPSETPATVETEKPVHTVATKSTASTKHAIHRAIQHASSAPKPTEPAALDSSPASGINGVGEATLAQPKILKHPK